MSIVNITNTSVSPMVLQSAQRLLLSRPMPNLIYGIPAMHKMLDARSGTVLRERRYENAPVSVTPLSPYGLTPPPLQMTVTNFDSQINWYGSYFIITDQVTLVSIEDVLAEGGSILTQNLRETKDQLMNDVLQSSSSVIQAVLGSNGDMPTNITADDIQNVVQALISASAMMFTEAVQTVNQFGSTGLLPSYVAMGHTDLLGNLRKTTGFVPSSAYPRVEDIFKGEYGQSGYTRILLSPRGSIEYGASNLGANVYNLNIAGRESFQDVSLDTAFSSLYYVPLGASAEDPLRQRQALSMKFASAERLCNDLWVAKVQCTLL